MKAVSVLLCSIDGEVREANATARELFGPFAGSSCAQLVRAEDVHGRQVCSTACATTPSTCRTAAIVNVRGRPTKMLCADLDRHRVVTLTPAPASDYTSMPLTTREREVLALVARGFTSPRVARRLGLSPATVRTHVEHIRDKLGVRTRSQAVAKAIAMGELD